MRRPIARVRHTAIPWRTRSTSHRTQLGQGAGRALLDALVAACARAGYRQLIAVIGDSANTASIGLHAACGFKHAGLLQGVGFKFGRWVDSVLMQMELGEGRRSVPVALRTRPE